MELRSDTSQYAFAMITALSLSLLVPSSALMSTTAYAQNQTQMQTESAPLIEEGLIEGNKSEPMRWSTYEDPILQFSIEYPSTLEIDERKDKVTFGVPDTYSGFEVLVDHLLTLDHSEYARDILNEERERLSGIIGVEEPSFKIIGLNETSINGQLATMAQYKGGNSMYLSYFMVTNDYTGYRLSYDPDFREDIGNFTERLPMIERMANSFRITK